MHPIKGCFGQGGLGISNLGVCFISLTWEMVDSPWIQCLYFRVLGSYRNNWYTYTLFSVISILSYSILNVLYLTIDLGY